MCPWLKQQHPETLNNWLNGQTISEQERAMRHRGTRSPLKQKQGGHHCRGYICGCGVHQIPSI